MPVIYITGPAGAGKSTVIEALQRQGLEAYDADIELCGWYNNDTGAEVPYPKLEDRSADWEDRHSFKFSESLTRQLYERTKDKTVYVGGNALGNDLEIADKYFSKVICLTLPEDVMAARVTSRTNNSYGNDPDQLAIMRRDFAATIDRYRKYGAMLVDSNRPIQDVVADILQVV